MKIKLSNGRTVELKAISIYNDQLIGLIHRLNEIGPREDPWPTQRDLAVALLRAAGAVPEELVLADVDGILGNLDSVLAAAMGMRQSSKLESIAQPGDRIIENADDAIETMIKEGYLRRVTDEGGAENKDAGRVEDPGDAHPASGADQGGEGGGQEQVNA